MTTVTSIAQLNAAIVAADGVTAPGTVTITLGSNITFSATALQAINLHPGVTLVIEGDGHTLSGSGTQRGLFVYAGTVEINDLAINNMLARGGNGGLNGGGGAGLGGGLFVGADVAGNAGDVTLTNVTFANNKAVGGSGGSVSPGLLVAQGGSGGGGLGGNGGDGGVTLAFVEYLVGAGGGGGIAGNGGAASNGPPTDGSPGIVTGAAAGGGAVGFDANTNQIESEGGSSGGGGGGGGARSSPSDNYGGGGGGVGGIGSGAFNGGAGGFGGGGGGGGGGGVGGADAGDGGFGGGGGGGGIFWGVGVGVSVFGGKGGDGGFGGGGGGVADNGAGTGGFGGGDGYGQKDVAFNFAGGGGGLGAGGNIFVQEGATLNIAGSAAIAAGTVAGGSSAWQAGQAFANGIYLQGNNTLTFSPTGTQTISGVIGDDFGSAFSSGYSAPAGYAEGGAGVTVNGTGTLKLTGHNTYVGATTVNAGRLLVDDQILSPVTVKSGGTLGGTGTVGFFFTPSEIESGGTLAPGDDGAGVFTSATHMDLSPGATFAVQLGGTGAGQFDQLVALSSATVDGAILDLSLINGFIPTVGSSFRIIDDQLPLVLNGQILAGVSGTFAGHAEGSTFTAGGARYTITYHGGDGNDVVLTVLTPNIPPVVTGAVTLAGIAEDSGARLITQAQLLGNATDADSPSLTATGLAIAAGSGTLVDNHNGTWSYTPAHNDDTSVSFSYHVTDGATSVADSATLDITPVNDAPVVAGVLALSAIAEDSGARLITQAQLLGNVTDPDGPPLTATGLAIATGAGTLVDNHDGTWSYTPALNDDTAVSFSYSVTDGVAVPVAGSATLDITPVNDAPVVAGLVTLNAIAEDSGARLITQAELLGNVTDIDGPSLTATGLAITTGAGSLVNNNDGTWSYTPAHNDDTSVAFSFLATDGVAAPFADSATLDITPVNDAPDVTGTVTLAAIAEDSGARLITQAQLLGNVTDIDGPALTAGHLAIAAGSGSLVDNNDGTWSFTPAHNDDTSVAFAWLVSDGTASIADSATLDITPVNDAPVNTMATSPTIIPNTDVAISGLAVSDVDSTSLTTTLHVDHGTLNVGAVGGAIVAGSGSSTVTLTGSAAQIDATLGAFNNVLYHSAFNFSGIDHLTMTSGDGLLGDTDVLNLTPESDLEAAHLKLMDVGLPGATLLVVVPDDFQLAPGIPVFDFSGVGQLPLNGIVGSPGGNGVSNAGEFHVPSLTLNSIFPQGLALNSAQQTPLNDGIDGHPGSTLYPPGFALSDFHLA
jgi:VCBS repeat-containing protein